MLNKLTHRIIIYSLILASALLVANWYHNIPKEVSPLGTVLSAYFYCKNTNCTGPGIEMYKEYASIATDPEIKNLYSKFVWETNQEPVPYISAAYDTWLQRTGKNSTKENYVQYWQSIRPFIQKTYYENIPRVKVENPIIHFRCSDIPYVRMSIYHLPKASSVHWMAQQIKERGFDKVTMISCNKHLTRDENSCLKYRDFYADLFRDEGIDVEYTCNSVLHDFSLMVYSPLLVSLNASTYGFMAGVSKNPEDYIACNMGIAKAKEYYPQTEADWILDHRAPLLHHEVDDYYDVEAVITKLRS